MSLPPRLMSTIRYSPPKINPARRIPENYRLFILQVCEAFIELNSLQPVSFRAAIASEWTALWNWLQAGLRTACALENQAKPHKEARNWVIPIASPLIAVQARIRQGVPLPLDPEHRDMDFKKTIFGEAPDFFKLLATALIVPFQSGDNYDFLLTTTTVFGPLLSLEVDSIRICMGNLEEVSFRMTGVTLVALWKTCVEEKFLLNSSKIDGERLHYFLNFLSFPMSRYSLHLDVVSELWPILYRVWYLLILKYTHIIPLEEFQSEQLKLNCLINVLACQKIWITGGPGWVSAALDNRMVTMIAKTGHEQECSEFANTLSAPTEIHSDRQRLFLKDIMFWLGSVTFGRAATANRAFDQCWHSRTSSSNHSYH
ncbi:hypothetical protein GYMLUDRAFT_247539 [Collybiopsis luxurians FD-317 M1]|uniref:Uncharacterized protein n=1 Tax=Collybiopsis luxurians FD-317 M1 TaxID=944289 RepID=A0A0D0C336_9AGAR|nr:hypothetical protein GYMLUDRAFT_247539 [Collybiopsis luxurians FD-317 M1]